MRAVAVAVWLASMAGSGLASAVEDPTGGQQQLATAGAGPAWQFAAAVAWESAYLTEGRDNLAGESLMSLQWEVARQSAVASVWFGQGVETDYEELELALGYGWEAGRWQLEAGAALLWFPQDRQSDQEFGLMAVYQINARLAAHLHIYHSLQAGASYQLAELASGGWRLGGVELRGKLGAGSNAGYIADGHRGVDHLAAAVEAEQPLAGEAVVAARLAYTVPVERNPARHPGDASLYHGWQFALGMTINY